MIAANNLLPPEVRGPQESAAIQFFLYGGGFCDPGGYAGEFRYSTMGSGSGSFYCSIGQLSPHFVRSTVTNGYGTPGIYLTGLGEIGYPANSYGVVHGGNVFNVIKVSNDTSYNSWHTIKAELRPSYYKIYFDGALVLEIPRNPALAIASFPANGIGAGGRNLSVDYWKYWDSNNQLRYFEDFNNPIRKALLDTAVLCSPGSVPDCQTAFVQYFNQKKGTNYTANQIDSLYLATCGKLPNPCGTNINNLQFIVDSFTTKRQQDYGVRFQVIPDSETGYTDPAVIFRDGALQLPAAAQTPGGSVALSMFLTGAYYCSPNGHGTEIRYRIQDATSGTFYANVNYTSFHIHRQTAVSGWGPPGLYLTAYSDPVNNINCGVLFGNNVFWTIYLTADTSLYTWHTVKSELKPSWYRLYFDGVKVFEMARNPALPILNHQVNGIGSYGKGYAVDYWKMFDENDQVRYFEDFNNPQKRVLPDTAKLCPAGAIPNCQTSFVQYFNQQRGSSYTLAQIEALYVAAGLVLDVCKDAAPSAGKLTQLLKSYKNEYYAPGKASVDLWMRTFGGDKTPQEGPKGVFDINENLIGNTIDGTRDQIHASFAQIWNSSAVNQVVGTLSALPNGQFRLQLNPGQVMPCNGIIGMRYYQFEIPTQYLNAARTGSGAYVDFGDGNKMKVQILKNSHTEIKRTTGAFGTYPNMFLPGVEGKHGYVMFHNYATAGDHTITVYHSDQRTKAFYNDCSSPGCINMIGLKNLRGYLPTGLLEFGFHSTQDITFNTTAAVKNFNELRSLQGINFANGGGYGFRNNNFGSFAANRDMLTLWIDNDPGLPASQIRNISEYLPNLPQNFPSVAHIRITPYDATTYGKEVDFRLPNIRAVFLQATGSMTAGKLDSIIMQVASTTTKDSGALGIWGLSVSRTSASDAAIATLSAKKWQISFNNVIVNAGSLSGYVRSEPAPDSIRYTNEFTDYVNDKLGTNLTLLEIINLYKNSLGYQPDYCGGSNSTSTLCGREKPYFPVALLDQIDNCSDSTFFIMSKAQDLRTRYVDSLMGSFDKNYLDKCMQAYKFEQFTVRHKVSEYHYTLYYYDQAGNLVKTIAPAGVRANYDSAWLESVKLARTNKQVVLPAHVMPTQYRYNTLNQVVAQKSPDGGRTDNWHDRLGRLVISRNARQLSVSNASNKYYSYTKYDWLGRITEVGQVRDTLNTVINDTFTRNVVTLDDWYLGLLANREQVTNTVYDTAFNFAGIDPNMIVAQQNVRNRVSYVTYTDTPGMVPAFNHASFYSYDIHGNADTVLQDYGRSDVKANFMNRNLHRWKKMVYEYDLISGKVNKVLYQPNYVDQFTHRYYYDAENRLTEVETSTDGFTWQKEAKYEYYLHGPLARTVIGEAQVQGVDYAYTLQGWLKGINSTGSTATHDIGGDGNVGGINQYVGRDALGLSLNYFDGEYKAINPGVRPFPSYRGAAGGGVAMPDSIYKPLFNGNISSLAVNIRAFEPNGHVPVLYNYRYDQLNRYVAQKGYFNYDATANTYSNWNEVFTFSENVSYDANGNIKTLDRNDIMPSYANAIDNLTYKYYPGTNRLKRVEDLVPDWKYGNSYDIDNHLDSSNYVYDSIGNLVVDKAEKITVIKWNVYGKITEITRNPLITDDNTTFWTRYTYDAQGNRIGKNWRSYNKFTSKYQLDWVWYVRDAKGNLLSTYSSSIAENDYKGLDSLYMVQADLQIYGSSRLGVFSPDNRIDNVANTGPGLNSPYYGTIHYRGSRQYELKNHLGNVLTVLSDRKIGVSSGGSLILPGGYTIPTVSHYEAEKLAANDYYPFGMISRTTGNSAKYKFGFNGKENDNEVKGGLGNQQDYGMRIYDPRLGRFLSVDPLTKNYPWYTPYQFAGNKPIWAIDLDGAEEKPMNDQIAEDLAVTTVVTIWEIRNSATNTMLRINPDFHNEMRGEAFSKLGIEDPEMEKNYQLRMRTVIVEREEVMTRNGIEVINTYRRSFVLEPLNSAGKEFLEAGLDILNLASVLTVAKAGTGPTMLFEKGAGAIVMGTWRASMSMLYNVRRVSAVGLETGLSGMHKLGDIMEAGMAFVGKNAKKIFAESGRFIGWESSDGLKLFRPPAPKAQGVAKGKIQANFMQRTNKDYTWTTKSKEAKKLRSNTHVESDVRFNYDGERQ